ncbi:hypothetical protein IAT38_003656 [Cryptococcus sp. DSM 104549]
MPPHWSIIKRSCAYHSGDTSGKTYDSDGKVCAALSADDKLWLAIMLSLCGVALIILGGIYAHRWRKSRAQDKSFQTSTRPMSSIGTPLIPHYAPYSPSLSSPYASSSASLHGPDSSSSSSSSHAPYSPNSENFHFPILSADGHLLPPPPASARRSVTEVDSYYTEERPLPPQPSPPAPLYAPIPKAPQRWSYTPVSDEGARPVGLYSGVEIRDDGSVEILKEEHALRSPEIVSPIIESAVYPVQAYEPQAATYHQTRS